MPRKKTPLLLTFDLSRLPKAHRTSFRRLLRAHGMLGTNPRKRPTGNERRALARWMVGHSRRDIYGVIGKNWTV